jgi:DNA polymerase III delta prime subunit
MRKAGEYCTSSTILHGFAEIHHSLQEKIKHIMKTMIVKPEEHDIKVEPCYQPVGEEIRVFETACNQQLPVLFKGPTGCGKTQVMEHMARQLTN